MGLCLEEIGELSFAEYTAAFRVWAENERMASQERFVVARLQALMVINATSTILKAPIRRPQDLVLFPWEEEPALKKQDPAEMKQAIQRIALAFGTTDKQKKVISKSK